MYQHLHYKGPTSRREKGVDEIMAENFLNLKKETDIKVHEAQRLTNKMNPNRPIPRHVIIKMKKVKVKERILKAAREKKSHIQGDPHKASS